MKNKPYLFIKETEGDVKEESRSLLCEAAEAFFRRENIPGEEILRTNLGKPYFPSGKIHLSVTHTGKVFAAVFAFFPIGIDMEPEKGENRKVAERFFSPEEQKMPFARVWTAKEAVAKLDGRGLSLLKKIRVEDSFAYFEDKKYLLERKQVGEYILTIARIAQ